MMVMMMMMSLTAGRGVAAYADRPFVVTCDSFDAFCYSRVSAADELW